MFHGFCNVSGSFQCQESLSLKKLLDLSKVLREKKTTNGATWFALFQLLSSSVCALSELTEELNALGEKYVGTLSTSCVVISSFSSDPLIHHCDSKC